MIAGSFLEEKYFKKIVAMGVFHTEMAVCIKDLHLKLLGFALR
jgi:hypothetical protein